LDIVLQPSLDEDVVVQHGHTPRREGAPGVSWIEFAPYERILALCESASAIVSHAGVGTIMTALATRRVPVVIPRLARHEEHVDDHQLQIARAFEERSLVVVLEEGHRLDEALTRARRLKPTSRETSDLRRAVAAAVG
jgi:UDP-N-acetylglucosamine transferase subunit ALG13